MIKCGLETLLEERRELIADRKVGILCHPPSVDGRLRHVAGLIAASGADLRCLFGPEHGVDGEAQDMVAVEDKRHPRLEVPVHTLYGSSYASLSPRPEWLEGLDVLVIDLQDVGSRYYTYVWTMVLTMRVCAERGVQVLVLDRPNPIAGVAVEGPGIASGFESFVGLHSVPVRHGLTPGELALLTAAELDLDLELDVIPLRGWRRSMHFDETGLPWVLPSPNMPTLETALVYPGGCLYEGTNISEGRGTTRPFEIIGAPYVDGDALARALDAERLAGVTFRPLGFRPTFQKHANSHCGGIQLHITDRATFAPLRTGVAVVAALRRLWPQAFGWRTEAYEFVNDRPAIDLLAGGTWLREGIEAGATLGDLTDGWERAQARFVERRQPFLRY